MRFIKGIFFFIIVSSLFFSSCKKDEMLTDSSAKLDFSTDSVLFDTVFTTLGSTTKTFRIYNTHSQPMTISRIYLATGSSSPFKLNVDGISGKSINDVEILGGDSLFVFVQVTVDPTGVNNPLLIKDSVIFETNNNIQDVKLTAVGQDVYLHKPNHFPTNGFPPYSIIGCNETWTNDKPHLIFGYAVVDSACTLTMNPGTRVHLYNGGVLWVYKDGTLIVNGTNNNEVTFQGTRLESVYQDIPGQWGKIWLSKGSKNNIINYAIIKNGGIGIQVDSLGPAGTPTLKLSNTVIKNMTAAALFAQGSWIWSNNCLFANCGQYVAALTIGGNYRFEHCTFGNYWEGSEARETPLLFLNNYYINQSTVYVRALDSCNFKNCILDGDLSEEIGIDFYDTAGPSYYSYFFDHCMLKTTRDISSPTLYSNCLVNQNSAFHNTVVGDYRLDAGSAARNSGSTSISVTRDLKDQVRPNAGDSSIPDMGCYEFY
jgi:hypothetical protein